MRPVDVEEVDPSIDRVVGCIRILPHMTHTIPDTGGGKISHEGEVVVSSLRLVPIELLRSAIVASVRIDGDHLDP